MLGDIWTVMWKERKGLLRIRGSRTRALLTLLVPVLMIAMVAPLQLGREWVDGAWSLVGAFLIPMILIGITIPESFAGERERHTLETLLASRLPDRAILFGKVGLAVAYGWIMTLLALGDHFASLRDRARSTATADDGAAGASHGATACTDAPAERGARWKGATEAMAVGRFHHRHPCGRSRFVGSERGHARSSDGPLPTCAAMPGLGHRAVQETPLVGVASRQPK
jgi:hypothetical protein